MRGLYSRLNSVRHTIGFRCHSTDDPRILGLSVIADAFLDSASASLLSAPGRCAAWSVMGYRWHHLRRRTVWRHRDLLRTPPFLLMYMTTDMSHFTSTVWPLRWCRRRRRARWMVHNSRRLMCFFAREGDHVPDNCMFPLCAPHPALDASVVRDDDGGRGTNLFPRRTLDGWVHHERALDTWVVLLILRDRLSLWLLNLPNTCSWMIRIRRMLWGSMHLRLAMSPSIFIQRRAGGATFCRRRDAHWITLWTRSSVGNTIPFVKSSWDPRNCTFWEGWSVDFWKLMMKPSRCTRLATMRTWSRRISGDGAVSSQSSR